MPQRFQHVAADAAFDAWYLYQDAAEVGGIAAIPLRSLPQATFARDHDGVPVCPKGLRMHPTYLINHLTTGSYHAQRYGCPLLAKDGCGQESCEHEKYATGGCHTEINVEAGGLQRVLLDRHSPLYHAVYDQRTSCERINSQAKELGIERPHVRCGSSVQRLNTLTYLFINLRALHKAHAINHSLLAWQ